MRLKQLINETYTTHQQNIIGPWARASSENMAQVFRFVIATVQQPLSMTPEIVKSFEGESGDSKFAFGFKGVALDWLDKNEGLLYDNAIFIWEHGDRAALLSYFASLPGLGLVKGGFFAQLCFGEIGCLDTHNINRFGLNAGRFKASRIKAAKTTKTRRKILDEYIDLCDKCGGCGQLWAEWCQYVAARDKSYKDAAAVSRKHLEALGLKEPAAL